MCVVAIEKYLTKRAKELGGEMRKLKWVGRAAPERVLMLPSAWRNIGADAFWNSPTPIWVVLTKPTAAQAREHELMRRQGQRVEVVLTLEAAAELLQQVERT